MTLPLRKYKEQVPANIWYTFTKTNGVISEKVVILDYKKTVRRLWYQWEWSAINSVD